MDGHSSEEEFNEQRINIHSWSQLGIRTINYNSCGKPQEQPYDEPKMVMNESDDNVWLKTHNNHLMQEIMKTKIGSQRKDQEINWLRRQLNEVKARLDSERKITANIMAVNKESIDSIKSELAVLREENKVLELKKIDLDRNINKVQVLKVQMEDALNHRIKDLTHAANELKIKLDKTQVECQMLRDEKKKLIEDNVTYRSHYVTFNTCSQMLNQSMIALETKTLKKDQEIEEEMKKYEMDRQRMHSLESQLLLLERKIALKSCEQSQAPPKPLRQWARGQKPNLSLSSVYV